jgi:hypothetical protein
MTANGVRISHAGTFDFSCVRAVLNTQDGSMTGMLANRDGVFALFGACTPL